MIQAFGLTSNPRKELPPAVDDVSFEARAGRVTALLGASGAGKTTALRLMLGLQRGRGLTYFRGRPLHRIAHPSREVGVLLGDVPGHPARTVRGHLRMLCAAAGVPVRRADEVLESVGLLGLRDERLGSLSRGMDRRLGLACALVPDPHTLVFDDPAGALSAHDARGLHGALRAHAAQGGTVLFSTADPKEAARSADHVVTLERGRVVADQEAAEFSRTRLRPRVAVRSPHAARLAALVTKEARAARRSVEVVREGGNRLAVYGSTCADIGEAAFRHGILVHQLADEVGDMGPGAGEIPAARQQERREADGERAPGTGTLSAGRPGPETPGVLLPSPATEGEPLEDGRGAGHGDGDGPASVAVPNRTPGPRQAPAPVSGHGPEAAPSPSAPAPGPSEPASGPSAPAPGPSALDAAPLRTPRPFRALVPGSARTREATATLPPPISVRSAPSPLRPLRYELRRAVGVRTGFVTGAVVLLVSAVVAVVLARVGHTPQPRLLAAWPRELPLPPAALGAGLLGALAFGDEFRHPALAADRGTVPRRMGLLTAKLLVSAATALLLAALTVGCDAEVLRLFYGPELAQAPADWTALSAGWLGLVIGCAWSGVLAAGVFRSTTAGLAAVVAVPVVVVPLVQKVWEGPSVRTAAGLPMRVREVLLTQWPFGGERYVAEVLRLVAQPVGGAMTLSLTALLCAYLLTTLRSRV
ncbi:ATP-binding cassette domain-containing protein [Streptomyces sp. ME02-6977A]|uniref:ABC transporter ATP-binding protein n=1 Tax=Streptomyces sp. ME02-6977A TaxID=3028671 RepID=UPI0029AB9527|nr:ATP-binding cassette domain-containing protein [Streptomyces sp. ME02-6977A]MDX3405014.1 ATP-binding cassette domain-containing protein [Streptomyces sp. ME02-6977A]